MAKRQWQLGGRCTGCRITAFLTSGREKCRSSSESATSWRSGRSNRHFLRHTDLILATRGRFPRMTLWKSRLSLVLEADGGRSVMIATEITESLLRRIRGELREMPGLRLTSTQATRLWHLDVMTATTLLASLVDAQFLYRTPTGAYKRVESCRPRQDERCFCLRGHPLHHLIDRERLLDGAEVPGVPERVLETHAPLAVELIGHGSQRRRPGALG